MNVHLGFEVGSGRSVEIPRKHMAITGQTQEAGKTTALEALIARADVRAVTFVTKRGEGSFTQARRIDPYFREQADWQFVASILEASRGEKLKFERAWIIRASKGARTLADVQRNVRKAMETVKGMSADVYLTLDAYLEAVVPQIAAVRWAPALQLAAGVNAMDLTGLNVEMQHLVIKSTLDWVLAKEESTVVVVPEAWKFIPQGRGTPVKLAAEAFVRQGAALKNFLWLDSQDVGGIEKTILRSVPLWILGVQRETNEIKRTLDNIPAGVAKPKAADIALLELGQFFACWGKHVIKTYVQPAWMREGEAHSVARGSIPIPSPPIEPKKETTVTNDEAARLTRENEQLKADNAELRRRLLALEERDADSRRREHLSVSRSKSEPVTATVASVHGRHPAGPSSEASATTGLAWTLDETFDNEALYQAFKARLIAELPSDSRVMELVLSRPELRVRVKQHVIEVDGDTLRGHVAQLIVENFFEQSRTSADIGAELARRGRQPSNIELGNELKALTEMGFFRRDNKWINLVPGMKVNVLEPV